MVVKKYFTEEELKAARNEHTKAYRKRNPEVISEIRKRTDAKRKQSRREKELLNKYGLSFEDYTRLVIEQEGVCAICKCPEKQLGKGGAIRPLNVDHCHTTGKVRGLLCAGCNLALGNLNDNIDSLLSAVSYLRKYHE